MKSGKYQSLILGVMLLAGILSFIRLFWSAFEGDPSVQTASRMTSDLKSKTSAKDSSVQPSRSLAQQLMHQTPKGVWEEFKSKFGAHLVPKFYPDGRIVWISGEVGSGAFAGGSFDPNDPKAAVQRAMAILNSARDLIGINDELPFEQPLTRTGKHSAQVVFRETYQGRPLAPAGKVRVDLGPNGELIRLDSDYITDLSVTNKSRLSPQAALSRASRKYGLDSLEGKSKSSGNPIIWIKGRSLATAKRKGYYAYEFHVDGYRVVIDADTGKVLYRRDHRVN